MPGISVIMRGGGRAGGRRVGKAVESRLIDSGRDVWGMGESIGRYASRQMDRRSGVKDDSPNCGEASRWVGMVKVDRWDFRWVNGHQSW